MFRSLLDFLLSRQWDLRGIGRGLGWTGGGFGMDGWTDLYMFYISLYVLYHFYNYFPPIRNREGPQLHNLRMEDNQMVKGLDYKAHGALVPLHSGTKFFTTKRKQKCRRRRVLSKKRYRNPCKKLHTHIKE